MTQAFNLSQLANNLNSSGQLDATDGLVNAVPVSNGGTGVSTLTGLAYGNGTSAFTSATAAEVRSALGTLPVSSGGTGATTLSGLAYGNGTSAFTSATASQIVSAIGSTAVANATNASSATTASSVTNGVYTTNFTGSNQSLGTNGYQKLPGGLIFQWGFSNSIGSATITFPTAFPSACFNVVTTVYTTGGNEGNRSHSQNISAISTTSFSVTYYDYASPALNGFYWQAIGY